MMQKLILMAATLIALFGETLGGRVRRELFTNEPCGEDLFRCDNGMCKVRAYRCDGDLKDCGDLSDEQNCNLALTQLFRFEWIQQRRQKAAKWLIAQAEEGSVAERWGYNAVKTTIALYLTNETYFDQDNETGKMLASELRLQMLAKLALRDLEDVSNTDLASYLNAFIISCIDIRNFHGLDLVAELRSRVDAEDFTNPFLMLTLCNAGQSLNQRDIEKLKNAFHSAHRQLWTDVKAYAVMALSCAAAQLNSNITFANIREFTSELKHLQDLNGTLDNLKSTGLVLQALIAGGDINDTEYFDAEKAVEKLASSQRADGSFEDTVRAYYVLPVFSYKSLINISSRHCKSSRKNEDELLREWNHMLGEKRQIWYSLWLGNDKYLERTLKLTVPANISFYRIMQVATRLDGRYRFKSTIRNEKPYIYSISDIEDDPENDKYWFPYIAPTNPDNSTTLLIDKSPIDYFPEDRQHLVFWFRKGHWITE